MDGYPSNHNYQLPYKDFFGGVSAMTPSQYATVNGFHNLYYGWGAEDDDLQRRIRNKKLGYDRLDENLGRLVLSMQIALMHWI